MGHLLKFPNFLLFCSVLFCSVLFCSVLCIALLLPNKNNPPIAARSTEPEVTKVQQISTFPWILERHLLKLPAIMTSSE